MTTTLNEARGIITRLKPKVEPLGYLIALYGSLLTSRTGEGNDIDLLFVPWREGVSAQACLSVIEIELKPKKVARGKSLMTELTVLIELEGGVFIDLQFRAAPDPNVEYERQRFAAPPGGW